MISLIEVGRHCQRDHSLGLGPGPWKSGESQPDSEHALAFLSPLD